MENMMWTIKYWLFVGMELFVVAALGVGLVVGLYQVVADKVREARRVDKVAPEAHSAAPETR